VNIRLGVLDDAPSHKPSFHIFVASKAPWLEITDNLTQFEAGPKL
ncbi:ADP-ribosylglycohydrolase, partial [Vibrio parahaemolyticus]